MMRQGQPANDVALYLPNDDGWAHMSPGNPHLIEVLREQLVRICMPAIFESGYNLDFFDDDSFKQVGKVENGSLVLGQNKYKIISFLASNRFHLETYQKFEEFVRGGGVLIATKVRRSRCLVFSPLRKITNKIVEISSSACLRNPKAKCATGDR